MQLEWCVGVYRHLEAHPSDHVHPKCQVCVVGAKAVQVGISPEPIAALEFAEAAPEATGPLRPVVHRNPLDNDHYLVDAARQPPVAEPRAGEARGRGDVQRPRGGWDVGRNHLLDVIRVSRPEGSLLDPHLDRQRAAVLELHDVARPQVLHALIDRIDIEEAERLASGRPADGDAIEHCCVERRGLRVPVASVLLVRQVEGHRDRPESQHRMTQAIE